jgi:hypothetical protein
MGPKESLSKLVLIHAQTFNNRGARDGDTYGKFTARGARALEKMCLLPAGAGRGSSVPAVQSGAAAEAPGR